MKKYLLFFFFFSITITHSQINQIDTSQVIDTEKDTLQSQFNVPIYSTSGADAESGLDNQDASGLLQSSKDVFTQFASFQFSQSRYRMRGYTQENQQILMNGVNIKSFENGTSNWSSWGGLNDVTRYTEVRFGNQPSRVSFSGPGGYTNIDSRASSFRKGTRISYASANRIFSNRLMATYSSGLMQNGWAFTISASTRQGDQVYVPGTYINANSFYAAVDKRWSDKHITSLVAFFAPTEQGRATAAVAETFSLTGNNYYNPLWGYQNGQVKSASVAKRQRPNVILSHIINISHDEKLTVSGFFNWGINSVSNLNWNNSQNPRPDYYRYLPSYYNSIGDYANASYYTNQWQNTSANQNEVMTPQINFDYMVQQNRANLYTDPITGLTGNRSRYIIENRVEDLKNGGLTLIYNKRIKNSFISGGLNANNYVTRRYKILNDLLGGDFWIDVDQFAQNLGVDPSYQQNDISKPYNQIRVGDKFGYDYSTTIRHGELWGQYEYSISKFDAYAGFSFSQTQIFRTGYVANGKFPTDSKGDGTAMNYSNYGLKGGLTYKLNGRNFFVANGSFITRPPDVSNIYVSPRTRQDIVNGGVPSVNILSGDISYLAKFPTFKARVTYYNTQTNNQVWYRMFWSDQYNNNVNYIMTGVNQNNQGIEIGLEKTLFVSHVIQACFGAGNYVYTDRPIAQAWQDNNNTQLFTNRTVYIKNYKIGGTPQTVAGLSYRYNDKRRWFVGIAGSFFANNYIEPNPDRRTAEGTAKYASSDPEYATIVNQTKLGDYFLLNGNAGYSFRILKKYSVGINLTVNNLLNNKNIRIWGFEQMRWDQGNINQFANKYMYMPGTTYMASINLTF
ncbi:MAG: hypothetical protein JSU07_04300 [Bacteroidetes bacterium]|nr:hypothetical protein [Bacteroidota bacterium]